MVLFGVFEGLFKSVGGVEEGLLFCFGEIDS